MTIDEHQNQQQGELAKARRARAGVAALAGAALIVAAACSSSGAAIPEGPAICVGIATACAELTGTACGRAQGCAPGICGGTATECSVLTTASLCTIQEGCGWDASTSLCTGTVEPCGRFLSTGTCVGQAGCAWSDGCAGWAAECSALSVSSCGAQPGCSVEIIDGGVTPDVGVTPDAPDNSCTGAYQPSPDDLIDDMEDGDDLVGPKTGWNGSWYVYHDPTTTGEMVPDVDDPITMEPIVGGRCGSTRSMRITGSGFDVWGAGTGFAFVWGDSGSLPVDFHQYDGIVFWARTGDGTAGRLRVNILDKDTEPQGGVCDPNSTAVGAQCYDHWGLALTDVGTEWKQYRIKFSDLAQSMFGLQVAAFDPTTIYGVEFQFGNSVVFDVWIDDISFTKP